MKQINTLTMQIIKIILLFGYFVKYIIRLPILHPGLQKVKLISCVDIEHNFY